MHFFIYNFTIHISVWRYSLLNAILSMLINDFKLNFHTKFVSAHLEIETWSKTWNVKRLSSDKLYNEQDRNVVKSLLMTIWRESSLWEVFWGGREDDDILLTQHIIIFLIIARKGTERQPKWRRVRNWLRLNEQGFSTF